MKRYNFVNETFHYFVQNVLAVNGLSVFVSLFGLFVGSWTPSKIKGEMELNGTMMRRHYRDSCCCESWRVDTKLRVDASFIVILIPREIRYCGYLEYLRNNLLGNSNTINIHKFSFKYTGYILFCVTFQL